MLKILNLSKRFLSPYHFIKTDFASFQKWIYAEKSQLMNVEFINTFEEVESESKCPFVVLDVRPDEEIDLADIPSTNSKGVNIPKINMSLNVVMKDPDALNKIPKDKYIICMCHAGVRSAYAAFHLKNRGYKCLNLYGGIDSISDIWEDIQKY
jgi:rhodanese-related sulfurtransferase